MGERISVALVGMGGYARFYLDKLLDDCPPGLHWVGAIDPSPLSHSRSEDVRRKGVPLFAGIEEFYRSSSADLMILATPIGLHCEQTCLSLAHGSHVLCEKPLVATIEETRRMRDARDKAGKIVAIGFQWSFSEAIQALKADVAAGGLGTPRRLKTLVLWPRTDRYYGRNTWAGRLKDEAGRWVLDSPVSNAASHFLHNGLYILGKSIDRSACPASLEAEIYRAYPIETFDSAALRCRVDGGAEILLYVSHAVEKEVNPVFEYEFDDAVVRYDGNFGKEIVASFRGGAIRRYGSPDADPHRKLLQTAGAIRDGGATPCGIEASIPHVVCVEGLRRLLPEVLTIPGSLIRRAKSDAGEQLVAQGLGDAFTRAYASGALPSEIGVEWARKGDTVDLTKYSY